MYHEYSPGLNSVWGVGFGDEGPRSGAGVWGSGF